MCVCKEGAINWNEEWRRGKVHTHQKKYEKGERF
jgi:hypothetical protein